MYKVNKAVILTYLKVARCHPSNALKTYFVNHLSFSPISEHITDNILAETIFEVPHSMHKMTNDKDDAQYMR